MIPAALIQADTIKPLLRAQPVTVGDIQYPANIFTAWSAIELTALGIHPLTRAASAPGYHTQGEPTYQLIGGTVIESRINMPVSLADAKAQKQGELDMQLEMDMDALVSVYPKTVQQNSWPLQYREAVAFDADSSALTPNLDILQAENQQDPAYTRTKPELVAIILTKAKTLEDASTALVGTHQRRARLIAAATSLDEVINI